MRSSCSGRRGGNTKECPRASISARQRRAEIRAEGEASLRATPLVERSVIIAAWKAASRLRRKFTSSPWAATRSPLAPRRGAASPNSRTVGVARLHPRLDSFRPLACKLSPPAPTRLAAILEQGHAAIGDKQPSRSNRRPAMFCHGNAVPESSRGWSESSTDTLGQPAQSQQPERLRPVHGAQRRFDTQASVPE